eukprot:Nk52_evm21s1129 gene=Nk52_evmTU21s1129
MFSNISNLFNQKKGDAEGADSENGENAAEGQGVSQAKAGYAAFVGGIKAIATKVTDLPNNFVQELEEENEKFNREKHRKDSDADVPPWVGYNEEEEMKKQILALSSEESNFTRPPPKAAKFEFTFERYSAMALATLKEDPELQARRFELVPKKLSEEDFWKNYFYRVSLIKQSSQLAVLSKRTGEIDVDGAASTSRDTSSSKTTAEPTFKAKGKDNGIQQSEVSSDRGKAAPERISGETEGEANVKAGDNVHVAQKAPIENMEKKVGPGSMKGNVYIGALFIAFFRRILTVLTCVEKVVGSDARQFGERSSDSKSSSSRRPSDLTDKKLKTLNNEKAESIASTDTAALSTLATLGGAEAELWEEDLEAELNEFELENTNLGIDVDKELMELDAMESELGLEGLEKLNLEKLPGTDSEMSWETVGQNKKGV